MNAVRTWGGVLEHPAYTDAWAAFGLPRPTARHGWTRGLFDPGASCYVEQSRYGHPAKKATWLYVCGVDELAELRWGWAPDHKSRAPVSWCGNHVRSGESRPRLGKNAAAATPVAFRDELIGIARLVHNGGPSL